MEAVDYSDARPSPAGLFAAGKKAAGRYVGPGSAPKHLTAGEASALHAAGLSIFLLVEGAAQDANLGRNMGISHARSAEAARIALGAPACALYFAVDWDVSAAQWPNVRAYLAGAASVIGVGRVGIYGGYHAMQWAVQDKAATWLFQTYGWSDIDHDHIPNWAPGVHIQQYHNGQQVAGGDVDLCRLMTTNYGGWTPASTPGDDMLADDPNGLSLIFNVAALLNDEPVTGGKAQGNAYAGSPNKLHAHLAAIDTALAAIAARLDTLVAPALTDAQITEIATAAKDGAAEAIDGATLHTGA